MVGDRARIPPESLPGDATEGQLTLAPALGDDADRAVADAGPPPLINRIE